MTKHQFHKIIFLVIYWLTAVVFYVFLEMAIEDYLASAHHIYELNYSYNFTRILIISLSVGALGGTALACFEVLFFCKFFKKKPLGIVLFSKTIFYLLSLFILISMATYLSITFVLEKSIFHVLVIERFIDYLSSPKLWALMLYWGFVVMSGLFVLHISEKLGQGILINYILGRYHKPAEENRIFMFLDLISSTSYAERLGHKKYSMLIQDCYNDLTDVVVNFHVQIYQYVGDEVVFTWKKEIGLQNNNCIKAFFKFEEILKSKENYYKEKYGFIPEFKAGINCGLVTVAEVGEMKKEIAYHGDAINIAARIRSACSDFNKRLLVSADLLSLLKNVDLEYKVESVGVTKLKGKKNFVGVFSIDEI
ncbi:MAG: adenylate/guanylate cyclase domain-containing protein [Ignavibacteriae bacterium]|nr:adenylate/guanylate cyclase domain-containing protein [Ignavibacteriota bacterium]